MEHYTMGKRESTSWPKSLLNPDFTFGHHVHDALDLPGQAATHIPATCMRVLHLQNLYRKRWRKESYYDLMDDPIESYLWVLHSHAEFDRPQKSLQELNR
jgi:hypothetical protein